MFWEVCPEICECEEVCSGRCVLRYVSVRRCVLGGVSWEVRDEVRDLAKVSKRGGSLKSKSPLCGLNCATLHISLAPRHPGTI